MTDKQQSLTDLIKLRHVETEAPRVGLKRTHAGNSEDEAKELREAYDRLRTQLSVPRIDRLNGRALATWDSEKGAVQVQRKNGKFEHFGYSQNGKEYLEYYEALFLIELNRLQLEYHGMIASVEQAYLLLLDEEATHRQNEYLVYSNLSRVGFIVTKHRNVSYEREKKTVTTTDCIWAILQHNINQKAVPNNIKKSPFFDKIKASMDAAKARIMQSETINAENDDSETTFEFTVHKRKAPDLPSTSKKPRVEQPRFTNSNSGSLVDLLKNEPEYKMFKHIFKKFSFIELEKYEFSEMDDCRQLTINFDLHLHNDGYRKSAPKPPTFSIIIVNAEEPFPSHKEIANCQHQLLNKTPLLLLTVSESKQIQAFLCHIS